MIAASSAAMVHTPDRGKHSRPSAGVEQLSVPFECAASPGGPTPAGSASSTDRHCDGSRNPAQHTAAADASHRRQPEAEQWRASCATERRSTVGASAPGFRATSRHPRSLRAVAHPPVATSGGGT